MYGIDRRFDLELQGGFNAGDGVRFFIIPGSRTNNILNLPSTSNVARDGQWMFRTDEASVEAGGCNTKGTNCKHKYSLNNGSQKHKSVDVAGEDVQQIYLKREK